MKKVAVMLAEGFEEVEAFVVVDLLRRAEIYVDTISLEEEQVYGSHGIVVLGDGSFADTEFSDYDMIVLPGGMPGTLHLREHRGLREVLKEFERKEKFIGAICAAPLVLSRCGILHHRKFTCYPSVEEQIPEGIFSSAEAIRDGHIITGRSLGSAISFALLLIEALVGVEKKKEVAKGIVLEDNR